MKVAPLLVLVAIVAACGSATGAMAFSQQMAGRTVCCIDGSREER